MYIVRTAVTLCDMLATIFETRVVSQNRLWMRLLAVVLMALLRLSARAVVDTHDSHFFARLFQNNNSYTFSFGVCVWITLQMLGIINLRWFFAIQFKFSTTTVTVTIAAAATTAKNERIINFHLLLWVIVLKAFPCWQTHGCFVVVMDPVAFGRTSNV